jgi:hypothetical protein
MNFLLFILFSCITISNTFASASPSTDVRTDARYASPPRTTPRAFNTPERIAIGNATKPSPDRASRNPMPMAGAILITASTIDNNLLGAPKHLVEELVLTQRRPFVIICPFQRSAGMSHVILTPTHSSDYRSLVDINAAYHASIEEDEEPFLSRNYGTQAEFDSKITHLHNMYRTLGEDYLQPLFYKEPKEEAEDDPDFKSSMTFSILGIVNESGRERLNVVGDVWLSHFEDLDVVCLKGTSERSTMVGLQYQSTGIGQAAVGLFNTFLVPNWMGKEVRLIEPDSEVPSTSEHCFDGILAYVEPANFKSIGNNFRSRNFLVGAINMGGTKPMLIFRAPTFVCTPEHLATDAVKQYERGGTMSAAKVNLFKLWGLVKSLYPSSEALLKGTWARDDLTHYAPSTEYSEALAESIKIIKDFNGFSAEYSEMEIAGSPHFPRQPSTSF